VRVAEAVAVVPAAEAVDLAVAVPVVVAVLVEVVEDRDLADVVAVNLRNRTSAAPTDSPSKMANRVPSKKAVAFSKCTPTAMDFSASPRIIILVCEPMPLCQAR